jgi:hypothetical protein
MTAAPAPTRRQVPDLRVRAQQLDRDAGPVAGTAALDIGVQDTGTDGALWAPAIRGVAQPPAEELPTVWTVRGLAAFRNRRPSGLDIA